MLLRRVMKHVKDQNWAAAFAVLCEAAPVRCEELKTR